MCMTAIHRKEMSMEHRCPKTVAVVGGGAAGMMAAICAARKGAKVLLLEKNSRPGRKIGITGKGRCNVTNADELSDFFKNIVSVNLFFNLFINSSIITIINFFRYYQLLIHLHTQKAQ